MRKWMAVIKQNLQQLEKNKAEGWWSMDRRKEEYVDWSKRLPTVIKMVKQGYTLKVIGDRFSVSKQRIDQVLKQHNLSVKQIRIKV